MFASIFGTVKGFLDPRFQVNYFLPSLVFWTLLIVVWVVGRGETDEALKWWGQSTSAQGFQLTGFLIWVVLFAYVVSSRAEDILRFYEGYWRFPGGAGLSAYGRSWHRRKLARIDRALGGRREDWKRYQEIYFGYPLPTQPDEVMPTRLGNILKNSELYPKDRYNIDAVIIWPRLFSLLPPSYTTTIANLRSGLDFMLTISVLAAVFAIISGGYLLFYLRASPLLFVSSFGGGLLVSCLAYRASLGSALLYAQQIKASFDLHRNLVLTQMRVPLPETRDKERVTWGELCRFLYRNIPPTAWHYEPADALTASATSAAGAVTLRAEASRRARELSGGD